MSPTLAYTIGVALVAFIIRSVRKGTWHGIWAGSGRDPNKPSIPGALHPPTTRWPR